MVNRSFGKSTFILLLLTVYIHRGAYIRTTNRGSGRVGERRESGGGGGGGVL